VLPVGGRAGVAGHTATGIGVRQFVRPYRFLLVLGALSACSRSTPDSSTYIATLAAARAEKDAFFRTPDGPLGEASRATFRGLRYYDPDPRWVVAASLDRVARPDTVRFVTSQRTFEMYLRIGKARFTIDGRSFELSVYQSVDGGLFVPFTDRTTGRETYGAGRYLDVAQELGGTDRLRLDFNRAYSPYCAYEPRWTCPLPPPENHLEVAVRAGERVGRDGH
jgi:uncharacterized protein (DUF1684 family)